MSRLRYADPVCDEIIAAAGNLGWQMVDDYNESDAERIGYAMRTIKNGERVECGAGLPAPDPRSAERDRRNRLGGGVVCSARVTASSGSGLAVEASKRSTTRLREIVRASGAWPRPCCCNAREWSRPRSLQCVGVDVVVDSPRVGAGMRGTAASPSTFASRSNIGYNKLLSTMPRQALSTLRYFAKQEGADGNAAYDIVAFGKSRSRRRSSSLPAPGDATLAGDGEPQAADRSNGSPACSASATCCDRRAKAPSRSRRPILMPTADIVPNYFGTSRRPRGRRQPLSCDPQAVRHRPIAFVHRS